MAATLAALLGCDGRARVGVDVITGLVPGPEFTTVVVDVFEAGQPTAGLVRIATVEARAEFGQDFLLGQRVAEVRLAPGEYRIRARLLRRDGSLLVERAVLGTIGGDGRTVSIALTRDCVGLTCPAPGGSPALTECLGGTCTDPRCNPPDLTFCPDVVFCNSAEDCGEVAACAERRCADGLCEPAPREAQCGQDEWCDPDQGCAPLPVSTPTMDAGSRVDAGDVDPGDAGMTGPVDCGTFCVPPDQPCRIGFWVCDSDAGAPFCDPIAQREPGYPCGPAAACSADGRCLPGDGAIPPPSTPGIALGPAAPRTVDPLDVTITAPGMDPEGLGAVTYEYRWIRDGMTVLETGPRIEPEQTRKGERWEVEVTPVSADGARRGSPATASVTIVNSRPTVTSVSLSSYQPVLGASLVAQRGPVQDDDDDSVTTTFLWRRNGAVVPGATGNVLTLGPGFASEDEVSVELTVSDGEETSAPAVAGPVRLRADVSRWRQLLPDRRLDEAGFVAFDPLHRRFLLAPRDPSTGAIQLWELAIDEAGQGTFAQLSPSGTPPQLQQSPAVYDTNNRRFLVFGLEPDPGGGDRLAVHALDVSVRGAERWTPFALGGDAPAGRFLPALAYDARRSRVLLYGGSGETGATFNDLWTLELGTAGAERWVRHDVPMPDLPIISGAFVIDAARDRLVMAGGGNGSFGTSMGAPSAVVAIYTLDLADFSRGFALTPRILARAALAPTVAVDSRRSRVLIGLGTSSSEAPPPPDDFIELDLATLTSRLFRPTGPQPSPGVVGVFAEDPYRDQLFFLPGTFDFVGSPRFEVYRWDAAGGDRLIPIVREGHDLPGPIFGATMAPGAGDGLLFGGIDRAGRLLEQVWSLEAGATVRWSLATALPDAITSRNPGPRAFVQIESSEVYFNVIEFLGGRGPGGVADSTLWSLSDSGPSLQWVEQTLAAGETAPSSREGAAFFRPACGAARLGFFGGRAADERLRSDTRFSECAASGRDCRWRDPVGAEPSPPARAHATAARLESAAEVWLFGGEDDAGTFDDLWSLDPCAPSDTPWVALTPTGTRPSPRTRHTMTRIARDTYVVLGGGPGAEEGPPLGDVFRLARQPDGTPAWEPVVVASGPGEDPFVARYDHMARFDEVTGRLLVYGGRTRRDDRSALDDLWELVLRP